MIAVAAVTYAEQRSFLYARVDQQARARGRRALARARQRRAAARRGSPPTRTLAGRPGPAAAPGEHGAPALPPGTYGQRRDAVGPGDRPRQISYSYERIGAGVAAAPRAGAR